MRIGFLGFKTDVALKTAHFYSHNDSRFFTFRITNPIIPSSALNSNKLLFTLKTFGYFSSIVSVFLWGQQKLIGFEKNLASCQCINT